MLWLLEFGDLHPCLTSSHADLPVPSMATATRPAPPLHSTLQAAVKNYLEQGRCLNNETFISHILCLKFEITTPTDPLSGKNPFLIHDSCLLIVSSSAGRVERVGKLMCFLIKAP